MFKFLVARLGYNVQFPSSPGTFQVAHGYWATTKSYIDLVEGAPPALALKLKDLQFDYGMTLTSKLP